MQIDKDKCVGCGNCYAWCTMGIIYKDDDGLSIINEDECVECNNCHRSLRHWNHSPSLTRAIRRALGWFNLSYVPPIDVCPTGALTPPELEWPRSVRTAFSDPLGVHPSTGLGGRGTEELKTNDVTGRLEEGDVGFVVEMGRPGLGARFYDIERVSMALAAAGVEFVTKNPVTSLMTDPTTGKINPEVLNEKVLSAIIEFTGSLESVPRYLGALQEAAKDVETVFSVGIGTVCDEQGRVSLADMVRGTGLTLSPNGKNNLGFGRSTP